MNRRNFNGIRYSLAFSPYYIYLHIKLCLKRIVISIISDGLIKK